jgi:hypothetical protein
MAQGPPNGRIVADIATTKDLLVCFPEEPMWKALRTMGPRDVSQLPVVKREGSRQLVGLLRRRDIIQAYNHAIAKKAQDQYQADMLRMSKIDDTDFAHVTIMPGSASADRLVSELGLPEKCLIVSVRRGNQLIIPHGYTRLHAKDRLTVLAENECLTAVERSLSDASACKLENADDSKAPDKQ